MIIPAPARSRARRSPAHRGGPALVALLLLATAIQSDSAAQTPIRGSLATAQLVDIAPMDMPGYLEPATDPEFGTRFVRITDPGHKILEGATCAPSLCRHRYSSAQAWNADQTLLLVTSGCPGLCFLDGQTYRPLFNRRPVGACEWHPTDPERMICVSEEQVYALQVRSGRSSRILAPGDLRGLRFGPGKGNLSRDGRRLVVRGLDRQGRLIAFAYDMQTATRFPDIALDRLDGKNSYCSISPSGEHVFCFQKLANGTNTAYVLSVEGTILQSWAEHHRPGHGDMVIDADGRDVYVGISKSDPDRYQVIKRRLDDGTVTVLTPRGLAQHASIRNIDLPGWVFLTFGGSRERVARRSDRLPFYREIVAIRIDGSGEMRRIVHTRSAEHDYASEAHGSPSPDGSQVIWASNWGQPGAPVASYVARVTWPEPVASRAKPAE